MSFFNPDVDKKLCDQCWHKTKPYMSKFGTYSPCIECKNGSNMENGKNNNSLCQTTKQHG